MRHIELRLYQYFVALCQERHFGHAAERLNISPSTLTNQIQSLEKRLSVPLLDRNAKNFQLTAAGKKFLESAHAILQQSSDAEATARKAAQGEIGSLDIGYMLITPCSNIIQTLLVSFQRNNPAIDISLHHLSTVQQINAILSNKLDAGFTRFPQQFPAGLSGFKIYSQPIILAMPANHRLAKKRGRVDPVDLVDEVFIGSSVEFELAFRRHVESIAELAGFSPKIRKRTENITTAITYAAAGYGIAAIARDLQKIRVPNVVFKEIDWDPPPQALMAFMYRTDEADPAKLALIQTMRAHELK